MDECIIISDNFNETDIFKKYYKNVKNVKISGGGRLEYLCKYYN